MCVASTHFKQIARAEVGNLLITETMVKQVSAFFLPLPVAACRDGACLRATIACCLGLGSSAGHCCVRSRFLLAALAQVS